MSLTIGGLAARAGVGVQTIRYYERHGLIRADSRTDSGYRLYGRHAERRLAFIRNAKALGFSLKEIAELLSLRLDPSGRCEDVRARAQDKIREVDARIRSLQRIRDTLLGLSEVCVGSSAVQVQECPILDALEPEEEEPCHESS